MTKAVIDPLDKVKRRLQREAARAMQEGFRRQNSGLDCNPAGGLLELSLEHVRKCLDSERRKARSGAASYDFNRHLGLLRTIRELSGDKEQAPAQGRCLNDRSIVS